ncbi:MAG: single-stranded-DNA-specific exonuclease RecJ, partial [Candidatus Wallbacteria bacterium]|nr:single-stranded-DNA-specific exonuclease RecJ [Candidatus Wallbacteria bacterium]
YSPQELSGVSEAVCRIKKAVADNEKILIYGDYDVDGITSIALLYNFFLKLGKRVDYFIPDRQFMGYGLNFESLDRISSEGYKLIITVDCGISNIEEVRRANSLGIDVIITDHHEPIAELPPAAAVINPKKPGETYPFKSLAGVGVAFKLFQRLLYDFDFSDHFIYSNLDIVALGTIADIVPLVGENRIIARYGLKKMRKSDNLGLNALIRVAGVSADEIESSDVAFVLAPRINACGRIDDPRLAVRLLTTEDKEEAAFLAKKLDEINRKRQQIEAGIMEEAESQIRECHLDEYSGLVLHSDRWHAGVIGIVTSKLKEKYYRPVILISVESGTGRASARSITGFALHRELAECSELLEKFGGHEMAAGFTIKNENISRFIEKFQTLITRNLGENLPDPVLSIDRELDFSDISHDLISQIDILAPFGMGNPQPLFITRDVRLIDAGLVGSNQRHLKLKVNSSSKTFGCIGFNLADHFSSLNPGHQNIDIAYHLSLNNYHDEPVIQLKIKDLSQTHF